MNAPMQRAPGGGVVNPSFQRQAFQRQRGPAMAGLKQIGMQQDQAIAGQQGALGSNIANALQNYWNLKAQELGSSSGLMSDLYNLF